MTWQHCCHFWEDAVWHFFRTCMYYAIFGTYFKNPIIFVIYQIFKFNWVSYILSGNATRSLDTSSELQGSKNVPMDRQFFTFMLQRGSGYSFHCIYSQNRVYWSRSNRGKKPLYSSLRWGDKKNSCLETRGSQIGATVIEKWLWA